MVLVLNAYMVAFFQPRMFILLLAFSILSFLETNSIQLYFLITIIPILITSLTYFYIKTISSLEEEINELEKSRYNLKSA